MRRPTALAATLVALAIAVAACSGAGDDAEPPGTASEGTPSTTVSDSADPADAPADEAGSAVAASESANQESHLDDGDVAWDEADEVDIELAGESATAGEGVIVDGDTVTITTPGTYRLSGELDGQVVVASPIDGNVRLVLDGVTIENGDGAAIAVLEADEAVIVLAEGTDNQLVDGAVYTFPDAGSDEPNATLYSAADLTIAGTGSLTVVGSYNDAIASKDGLVVVSGDIVVDAVDDGIRGKDYVIVHDAAITVAAGGDGIKADNEDDTDRGYVLVEAGTITVAAGGDGIDAATDVELAGGVLSITTAGGSSGTISEDDSAKGVKGDVSVLIDGVDITVDSADDAIHSNGTITMASGTVTAATGDDGFHADTELTIADGTITIDDSYEGLESAVIRIAGGVIDITADDDGINVAGGTDGSGVGGRPGRGGSRDGFSANSDYWLYIEGGTTTIDADGDGLDANGSAEMTGGTVVVDGPTGNMDGAIDVIGTFSLTGGVLAASGSAGMAEAPDAGGQAVLGIVFNDMIEAGTLVTVEDDGGNVVAALEPSKPYQTVVLSTPALEAGASYTVSLGGSADGTDVAGLYLDATVTSATIAGTVSAT